MTCLLTVTLHIVDVRLTCLINITYLLTYLHRLGGMIDVVATRQDLTTHNVEVVDIGLSNYR